MSPRRLTPKAAKPKRTLRRDAAENRNRLLAAAADVFDKQGLDASVTDVARAAGVGMGTLYRRFPTKEALIEALVHEILETTIAMARRAAQEPDGTGLEHFLEVYCTYQQQHPGCLPRLWNTDDERRLTARRLIADLLTDAQDHGRIRKDVTNTDLTVLMFSIRGVLEATGAEAPNAWRRHLELLIAGMRPAADDLRHPPLSQQRLDRLVKHRP